MKDRYGILIHIAFQVQICLNNTQKKKKIYNLFLSKGGGILWLVYNKMILIGNLCEKWYISAITTYCHKNYKEYCEKHCNPNNAQQAQRVGFKGNCESD